LIEKIFDRKGGLLEDHQVVRESVISPQTAYIMTHLLQGVIEEGTGQKAKELGRPAAGKTGTTNEMKDAWFIGYTPSTLAGVWVGYDDHTLSLGKGETGGRAACPIWLYFMKEWLKNEPVESFPIPADVVFAKVNPGSGIVTRADDPNGVYAAFSGGPPSGANQYGELGERPNSSYVPASGSESFFKSDLF
jgi:penicillin-binding protein 1A